MARLGTTLVLLFVITMLVAACSAPAATQVMPNATPTLVSPTATVVAAPTTTIDRTVLAGKLDKFFGDLEKTNLFSGMVYFAADDGLLYEKGFGTTKKKPNAPLNTASKYRIGSVTKNFTAAAILQLQAQGKLNVQDRVCTYMESCPDSWDPITLHQLLTHTASVPSVQGLEFTKPQTPQEMAAKIVKQPIKSEAGTHFEYSNEGYIVLGAVIEKAAEKTYERYLRETFWGPLGMHDTGIFVDDGELAGYAITQDYTNLGGGGSIYSTVRDLVRWEQALDEWERDPSSIYHAMFQPQTATGYPDSSYGYGMWLETLSGLPFVYHTGAIAGYGAIAGRFPELDVTVIILSNNGYTPSPDDIANFVSGSQ